MLPRRTRALAGPGRPDHASGGADRTVERLAAGGRDRVKERPMGKRKLGNVGRAAPVKRASPNWQTGPAAVPAAPEAPVVSDAEPAGAAALTDPEAAAPETVSVPKVTVWTRLRAGTTVLTIEARNTRTGERRMVRLLAGFLYPLPPDVHLGKAGKPHPMIVRENVQHGVAPLTLAQLDTAHWDRARASGARVVSEAERRIRESAGGGESGTHAWVQVRRGGWAAIVDRLNAIREAAGEKAVASAIPSPEIPKGVVPLTLTASAVGQRDQLACGACGGQQASVQALTVHASRCTVLAERTLTPAQRAEIEQLLERGVMARALEDRGR